VYFNAQHNFTLQYPVLLAPLLVSDDESTSLRKIRVVSAYIDVLIHRRIWNFRAIDYSTMQYAMFLVMREIRSRTTEELVPILEKRLDEEDATFETNERFRLHGTNGRQIHRVLARLTDFVETQSGHASRYAEYIQRAGKNAYEIEHIWANHPERHLDEFSHAGDFQEHRNRIGGLLLLPKSFNASYGDLEYRRIVKGADGELKDEGKRQHYMGQNLLAQSLHEQAYERNPGFVGFKGRSGLPFQAHAEFKKADLNARQALYQQLASRIWGRDRLTQEASR
jgi:hypothetical protein